MKTINQIGQFSLLLLLLVTANLVSGQYEHYLDSLRSNELYEYVEGTGSQQFLAKGNSEEALLQLEQPILFYGVKYQQIYINTNGILTFLEPFPEYLNQPLPLETPLIAAFYSNVDTTNSGDDSSISVFQTTDSATLLRAQQLVQYAFNQEQELEVTQLVVATWRNVGYFDSKTDKLNSFQVALIANEERTFVHFIYPEGGLNWLRGEAGELGLPDIRAQVGFVAEDGSFYNLNGSGSENARFLSDSSNLGVPGVWLYQVSPINPGEKVQVPNNAESLKPEDPNQPVYCSASLHECDPNADCHDKSWGHCCVCRDGFYGNGRSCLANDAPIRVTGTLSGQINDLPVDEDANLQIYVVTTDAHGYTTVNPIKEEFANQLRLVLPVLNPAGWLFAKPANVNGYQLTGGQYEHNSRIDFDSGEVLQVKQIFEGLNYWDQLVLRIELNGTVPRVSSTTKLHFPDYAARYYYKGEGEIQSDVSHKVELVDEQREIGFKLSQSIIYTSCILDEDRDPSDTYEILKTKKVTVDYLQPEEAIRSSAFTSFVLSEALNACAESSGLCGENAVCVPTEDAFYCQCQHGYEAQLDENQVEICVDLDECAQGTHVCDEHAFCSNNPGGYSCVCVEGFEGNGYRCVGNNTADNIEYSTAEYPEQGNPLEPQQGNPLEPQQPVEPVEPQQPVEPHQPVEPQQPLEPQSPDETEQPLEPEVPYDPYVPPQHHVECSRCAPDADCYEGRCGCRDGFSGDGYSCTHICGHDEVWEEGRCVPLLAEVSPNCNFQGDCSCPEGYELTGDTSTCRYTGSYVPPKNDDLVYCDVDDNCHIDARCSWYEHEYRHICVCNPGFSGDGYRCDPIEDSCAIKPEICDEHATCNYNEALGKSVCDCEHGYNGDGHHCQLSPECVTEGDCGENAFCDSGVCQCQEDFYRDGADRCVPNGRCGSVYCGTNAICRFDVLGLQYCTCIDGYQGNPFDYCDSIPEPCNVRNNCGLNANCVPSEDGSNYTCQCNEGFSGDGIICFEEQNCLNNPTLCDMNANCQSTNGGLVCVCKQGFYGNGSVCLERQQHDSDFLIVSQGVVIVRVPLNGRNVQPIRVASMAIGLDKDCVEGRIYWGDISTKKILSVKYDGTDEREFITTDIESPEGIAIDVISRRLYWTDSVKDTIEVASLDDPKLRTVIINKQLVNPRGIAIDPYREKLYWSDWDRSNPKIEFSDLDGTGRELLLGSDSVKLPNSLVVLEHSGELCFADAGNKKVECIDSQSRQIRTISQYLSYPFGLTFTHDQFYWTDWTTKKLESVDSTGTRQKPIQTSFFGSHKMYAMTAVEQNCPQYQSLCQINNGGCTDSRLCLVNRKAPSGKSCKCTSASTSCPQSSPLVPVQPSK